MALVSLTVTPRKLAANRANARRSRGPRTLAGKMRSRLSALRDGTYSELLDCYGRLWLQICVNGPSHAPDGWKFRDMPVPLGPQPGDSFGGEVIREILWRARGYLPLGKQRKFTRRDFEAERQPKLQWGRINACFLGERPHEVIENRQGGGANRAKNRQNEAPTNSPKRATKPNWLLAPPGPVPGAHRFLKQQRGTIPV